MAILPILQQIFYFIIIGVLVLVHELGHFLSAKLFGMRVDRFSIGFPPRMWGKKIGDTDYCISWLPIGGYVKIAGMIDESLDTEHLEKPAEPWEFRAKPIWQRIIVISAGVIMNVLLAVAIFWGINLVKGKSFYAVTTVGHVDQQSIAAKAGMLKGDKILFINSKKVSTWEDVLNQMYIESMTAELRIDVDRSGKQQIVSIPKGAFGTTGETGSGLVPEGYSAKIISVETGKPAHKIGIVPGDIVIRIDGADVFTPEDVTREIHKNPNKTIVFEWKRNGQTMSSYVTPNEYGKIGIGIGVQLNGPSIIEKYNVFEAFTVGTADLVNFTGLYLKSFGQIITGKASFKQSVGGPIRIAEMASQTAKQGLVPFLTLMAMLSVGLAIINIFPFPALDGGHVFFLIYEAIFRREIPNKIRIFLQQAGMIILLAFMAFVIYNDIFH